MILDGQIIRSITRGWPEMNKNSLASENGVSSWAMNIDWVIWLLSLWAAGIYYIKRKSSGTLVIIRGSSKVISTKF